MQVQMENERRFSIRRNMVPPDRHGGFEPKTNGGTPKRDKNNMMYQVSRLGLNDCLIVASEEDLSKLQRNVSAAACNYGKKHNMSFTTRIVDSEVRLYRTA